MTRQHLLSAVLLLSLVNGIFSPFLLFVVYLSPIWLPGVAAQSPAAVLYLSSLLLSTLTLAVSGVPAALYERATKAPQSSVASVSIWVASAGFLSVPGIIRAIAILTGGPG